MIRQVELKEPGSKALAAASLAEWQEAQKKGRLAEYESVYGLTAEPPISDWEGHDPQWLSANEFESVWSTARRQIQDRQRQHPSRVRPPRRRLTRKLPPSVQNLASGVSPS